MKTFQKFKSDVQELNERLLNEEELPCHICGQLANTETGNGLTFCGDCGKPTCYDHRNADDPGDRCTKCKPPVREDEGGAAPTNCVGSANIAGVGVQRPGEPSFAEPGVSPLYQRKRKQLGLVGPPAVDPRMFADKIFNHAKRSPVPVKEEVNNNPPDLSTHGFSHHSTDAERHEYHHTDGRKIHLYHQPPKHIKWGDSNSKKHDWEIVKRSKEGQLSYKTGKGLPALHDTLSGKKKEKAPSLPLSVDDRVTRDFFRHVKKSGNPSCK